MQLLRDSTFQKIKAIVNIRAAYNKFMKIEAWEKTLNESGEELDIETKAGMHFGVGAFNMVSSLLPPKVLALVSFLGFPHDRQFGLDELQKTLDGGGVRSPVAALALLLHHVYLQGSFCHTGELPHAAAATKVLDQSLELFPNGGIFLFMKARNARLHKDCEGTHNIRSSTYLPFLTKDSGGVLSRLRAIGRNLSDYV